MKQKSLLIWTGSLASLILVLSCTFAVFLVYKGVQGQAYIDLFGAKIRTDVTALAAFFLGIAGALLIILSTLRYLGKLPSPIKIYLGVALDELNSLVTGVGVLSANFRSEEKPEDLLEDYEYRLTQILSRFENLSNALWLLRAADIEKGVLRDLLTQIVNSKDAIRQVRMNYRDVSQTITPHLPNRRQVARDLFSDVEGKLAKIHGSLAQAYATASAGL